MTEDRAFMLCSDIKDQFIRKNFVTWDVLTIILQHELYCVSNVYNRRKGLIYILQFGL